MKAGSIPKRPAAGETPAARTCQSNRPLPGALSHAQHAPATDRPAADAAAVFRPGAGRATEHPAMAGGAGGARRHPARQPDAARNGAAGAGGADDRRVRTDRPRRQQSRGREQRQPPAPGPGPGRARHRQPALRQARRGRQPRGGTARGAVERRGLRCRCGGLGAAAQDRPALFPADPARPQRGRADRHPRRCGLRRRCPGQPRRHRPSARHGAARAAAGAPAADAGGRNRDDPTRTGTRPRGAAGFAEAAGTAAAERAALPDHPAASAPG